MTMHLVTQILTSMPPGAQRVYRHASVDMGVRSASLVSRTGLRAPTRCPNCGCAVLRLLRCLAKLGAGPALHAPLQLAFTLLTPDGRAGPLGALSTKACDRTNATCLSLESDRVAAGLISKLRAQERWGNLHRLQDLFTRCFS